MGILDLLSGNNTPDDSASNSYVGNLIDPATAQQFAKQQFQNGLMGLAAGLLQGSGPSRLPVPFGSAFGAGLQGYMNGSKDFTNQALEGAQTANQTSSAQVQKINAQAALQRLAMARQFLGGMAGPDASTPGPTPTTGTPATSAAGNLTAPSLSLIKQYESGNNYSVGFGGTDLSSAKLDANGFPIWGGNKGPSGISHAAGAYQFEPATWAQYAKPLGITDFSPASQDKVAAAAFADQGWSPWAPYNPKLAAAAQQSGLLNPAPVAGAPTALTTQTASTGGAAPQSQTASPAPISGVPQSGVGGLQMSPQQAFRSAIGLSLLGEQVPGVINDIAGLPAGQVKAWQSVGPNIAEAWGKPQVVRPGAGITVGGQNIYNQPQLVDGIDSQGNPVKRWVVPQMPGTATGGAPAVAQAPTTQQGVPPNLVLGGGLRGTPGLPAQPAPQSAPGAPVAPTGNRTSQTIPAPTAAPPSPTGQIQTGINPINPYGYSFKAPVGKGPGQDEPLLVNPTAEHPYPSIIPPVSEAAPIVGSKETQEANQKDWAETTKQWAVAQAALPQAQQRIGALAQVMKSYQTGAFAEHMSDFVAMARAAGLRIPPGAANDPAGAEIILKNNFGAAIDGMKATGLTRWTQSELFGQTKNFANTDLQPVANFEILAQTQGRLAQQQAEIQDWAEAQRQNWRSPQDFERAWLAKNPLDRYVDIAKVQIGPLAGMTKDDIASTMPKTATLNGQKYIQSGGGWYPLAQPGGSAQ